MKSTIARMASTPHRRATLDFRNRSMMPAPGFSGFLSLTTPFLSLVEPFPVQPGPLP